MRHDDTWRRLIPMSTTEHLKSTDLDGIRQRLDVLGVRL
jgi:hypothetical protein